MINRRILLVGFALSLVMLAALIWHPEPSTSSWTLPEKGAGRRAHCDPLEMQRTSLVTASKSAESGSFVTQDASSRRRVPLSTETAAVHQAMMLSDSYEFTVTLPLVSHNYQVTFDYNGYAPLGFLDYDDQDYVVYEVSLCGRPVVTAWERAADIERSVTDEVSTFYFATFASWCELFGHFPYASYTVVLEREPEYAGGETGIGYEGTVWDYVDGHHQERIAHEVFHGWVGGFIWDGQETKYDDGLWFREGVTQYYGDRGAGESLYMLWMQGHLQHYQTSIVGTKYDIPLTDMPQTALDTGDSQYRLNVYWKGALVAYLMDKTLVKQGLNLDVFLRHMYYTYGWSRQSFVTGEAIEALNELTGSDWSGFFDRYIYGTELLPLDGSVSYVPR
jgi:hypothetical protein